MTGLILTYRDVSPRVAEDAFVAPGAAVIGDVEIGSEAGIWFNCVVRGDINRIRIGARSSIQDGTVIHVSEEMPALVGANVTVGRLAMLHACTLEDGCLVGMKATVLDGAVVESGAMVAAGALVAPGKRVRTGELWAGVPASYKRPLRPEEVAEISAMAERYARRAQEYRALESRPR